MYMYVREKMKAYVCMLKECACMYHVHVHVMLSTKLVRNAILRMTAVFRPRFNRPYNK